MSKVTIIVPVYKVENYLRRCLESIRTQTYTDYECILVDDASPDNCPSICDEYVKIDGRFSVIHMSKNEGLSAARMTGLTCVKTKYVMHVDSDDTIEPDALKLLVQKAESMDAKIVIGSFRRIIKSKSYILKSPPVKTGIESLEYLFLNETVSLWGKLYKSKLFENLGVSPFTVGEDAVINAQIFSRIQISDITNIDEVIYNYYFNDNSILGTLKKETYVPFDKYPWFTYKKWIGDYISAHNVSSSVTAAYYKYLTESMSIFLLNSRIVKKTDLSVIYSHYETFNKQDIDMLIRMFIFLYCKFPFIVSKIVFMYKKVKILLKHS
jgi:glycosyltransferase involved in cell wall biosynthesis